MMKWQFTFIISLIVLVDLTECLTLAQSQVIPEGQVNSHRPRPPHQGKPEGITIVGTNQRENPSRQGAPDKREPSGTRRGYCEETDTPFTPLLPVSESGFSGLTLNEHPTFWFYIPYQTSSVSSGQFSLIDQEDNEIYWMSFQLPETPGFVKVSIPQQVPPLVKNQEYRWHFELNCASTASSSEEKVWHQGVVQKVELTDVETQLNTTGLVQRVNLYIANSIWYDASTELVQIHDIPQAWRQLLQAVGSEQLAGEPIAGSVVVMEESISDKTNR
ncbi:MAG: DUF928 domain-containing protein [Symploca sp. SIO3E6]|nr:DUF928 domain-containing protein [Caldora sp. SIO3E6]